MADFVDAPAPVTPEPEKLPVTDFDFTFMGRELPLQVTVWSSMGDTWVHTVDGYLFKFPRLGIEQEVLKTNMLSVQKWETKRVPFSAEEFQRKMAEAKKKKNDGKEAR